MKVTTEATSLSGRLRAVSFQGHGGRDDWEEQGPPEPTYYDAYLKGGLSREGIAAQVAQHFLMYESLETATQRHRERLGEAFAFWMPELHRLPAIVEDLHFWIGNDWEEAVRGRYETPGILEYVARINEIGDSLPHFVAHHYTRYLADLSGGLMIAKMFADSYKITGDEGVRFYRFPDIDDPMQFKARYRGVLDSAGFTPEEEETIVEEVALAYRLNNRAGRDLQERLAEYLEPTE